MRSPIYIPHLLSKRGERGEAEGRKAYSLVIRLIEVGGRGVTLTNWVEVAVLVIVVVLAVRFFQKRS
jgi:hypothetical protein